VRRFLRLFSRTLATKGPPKALFDHPILSSFLEAYPFPFYIKDADLRYLALNPARSSLLGVDSPRAALGKTDKELGSDAGLACEEHDLRVLASNTPMKHACTYLGGGSGQPKTLLEVRIPACFDEGRSLGVVGIALDPAAYGVAGASLNPSSGIALPSLRDPLTGLPNRMLFQDRLAWSIAQAKRSGHKVAVLSLDIDRFRTINNSLGPVLGDRLIKAIAERLRKVTRDSDTLARVGGDEFMALLNGISHTHEALKVASRMAEVLKAQLHVDGRDLFVTASIGISVYPNDAKDAPTLIQNAETALSKAKVRGGSCEALYDPMMNERALERLMLESDLRKALEAGTLLLHYQPIFSMSGLCVVGFEALLRWQHPRFGLLLPAAFIPLAEETGLIVAIGRWVVHRAFSEVQALNQRLKSSYFVSVNLSAKELLFADLVPAMEAALEKSGMPGELVVAELTESTLMHNLEVATYMLSQLKRLGMRVAIDDFGTGYSSLAHLKHLNVDILKIDKMFIQGLGERQADRSIVQAINAMANALELEVVAEGVERKVQLEALQQIGSGLLQGFFLARPMDMGALEGFLRRPSSGAPEGD
jgi:diguanylate cyclase (GGDEF)-like protein